LRIVETPVSAPINKVQCFHGRGPWDMSRNRHVRKKETLYVESGPRSVVRFPRPKPSMAIGLSRDLVNIGIATGARTLRGTYIAIVVYLNI
jgi:hypothetical protein